MPLGGRDVLIMVRAVDMASATLTRIGGAFGAIQSGSMAAGKGAVLAGAALTGLGLGLIALGKQGIDILKGWASAAADYNQTAALTLTQVDDIGISLEDIKRVGRDVAKAIPAPFEQMQASLFDIFSSMEVGLSGAQTLLTAFAKAAVAGQTDVQTAGKGSIAVMNAFKIPVENVNQVMDTQFQLVRKGVGTYEEFANVLGRVAPSAVRMGQSFETTAGMLAFLTRNGLNAFQASTSAARALDTLSKIKVQERLEAMGIAVRDATGEYRPLVDIVGEMNDRFGQLTKPERSKALEDLFFGAGNTVAARRFFDTVFTNFDQFESLVGDMQNSAGAMDAAYDIMFEQPQTQSQLLKNNIEVLRSELGDRLIPIMQKITEVALKVVQFFGNMSEGSKDLIVKIVAGATAFALIAGVVLTVIGAFLILKGIIVLAGVSFVAVGAAIAIAMVWLIALAAIAFIIYKNWDTLGPIFKTVFEGLKAGVAIAWQYIQQFAAWVMTWLPGVWENVKKTAGDVWDKLVVGAQLAWTVIQAVVAWLVANVPPAFETIKEVAGNVWGFIQEKAAAFFGWLQAYVFPVFVAFADMVTAFVDRVLTIWNWLWQNLATPVAIAIGAIFTFLSPAIAFWLAVFQNFWDIIMAIWPPLWEMIKEVVGVAWNFIKQTIEAALTIITGIFNFFAALFSGDWAGMWEAVKQIASGAWQWIRNIINTAVDLIFALLRGAMNIIWQIMQAGWDNVVSFATSFPGKVWNAVASLIDLLWDLGTMALRNLGNAVINGVSDIVGFMNTFPSKIGEALKGLGSLLFSLGKEAIQGLLNGLKSLAGAVADTAKAIGNSVKDAVAGALSIRSPSLVMDTLGKQTIQGFINGISKMTPMVMRELDALANSVSGQQFQATMAVDTKPGAPMVTSTGDTYVTATFHIYEATDAEKTGEIVEKKLDTLYRELQAGPHR